MNDRSAPPVIAEVLPADVRRALDRVVDPCSIATGVPITIADMGLVQAIEIDVGRVTITLGLTSPVCFQVQNILGGVKNAVGALPGVTSVECEVDPTAEWMPDMMAPSAQRALRRVRPLDRAVPRRGVAEQVAPPS